MSEHNLSSIQKLADFMQTLRQTEEVEAWKHRLPVKNWVDVPSWRVGRTHSQQHRNMRQHVILQGSAVNETVSRDDLPLLISAGLSS